MYYLITKSYEYSSDRIMDWFYFLNQHVVRFNTDDFRGTKINISNKELDNKKSPQVLRLLLNGIEPQGN